MTSTRTLTIGIAGLAAAAALGSQPRRTPAIDTSFNTRQHQVRYVPADGGAFCIKERRGRYIVQLTRFTRPLVEVACGGVLRGAVLGHRPQRVHVPVKGRLSGGADDEPDPTRW
jgi:hypothetical protein